MKAGVFEASLFIRKDSSMLPVSECRATQRRGEHFSAMSGSMLPPHLHFQAFLKAHFAYLWLSAASPCLFANTQPCPIPTQLGSQSILLCLCIRWWPAPVFGLATTHSARSFIVTQSCVTWRAVVTPRSFSAWHNIAICT